MRLQLNSDNLTPKKSLGQNFIINKNFLISLNELIVSSEKNIIIEIGPGKGALTNYLSQKEFKKLYLIEKDYKLSNILAKKYKDYHKIDIITQDALLYDFKKFKKNNNILICGNLPFNISTKLLILWLNSIVWPSFFNQMILMFQKEVAERIIAKPNTKKYGRLSVLVQARCNVIKVLDAPSSIFSPQPKVDGAVLFFKPVDNYSNVSFEKLGLLLEKAFKSRRKKIKNTLGEYDKYLSELNIDQNLRPENLTVSDYCKLVKLIN